MGSAEYDVYAFVTKLTHELRTSLTAVSGFTEMMYDAKQSLGERLSCLGRIRENIKYTVELLEEIGEFGELYQQGNSAALENSLFVGKPVTFSLLPELGHLLSSLKSQIWKKQLHLKLVFQGDIPETIFIDPKRFRQIILHAFSYVLDQTPRGSLFLSVSLDKSTSTSPLLCFTLGRSLIISTPLQPVVPRSKITANPTDFSVALNLKSKQSIATDLAHLLVEGVGGRIEQDRQENGQIAAIRVSLPTGPLDGVRLLNSPSEESCFQYQTPVPEKGKTSLFAMRILLVEDSPDSQLLVSHFLKYHGATVRLADDGKKAIQIIAEEDFDVILMDLELPEMDGCETTVELRRSGVQTPIIVLTAHSLKEVRERALRAGCNAFLTKPILTPQLIETLLGFKRVKESPPSKPHHSVGL